jgi:hypothetical protein
MSAIPPDSKFDSQYPEDDSLDTQVIIIDGPGDTTVRPLRPHLLKIALAERERMERLLKQWEEEQASDKPPTDPTD